ncbi:hypothetical protein ABKV19_018027 [Rosa sericea]
MRQSSRERHGGSELGRARQLIHLQVVYILDQVRALDEELLLRINQQGLPVKPQILMSGDGKLARQMTLLMAFCDYLGNCKRMWYQLLD